MWLLPICSSANKIKTFKRLFFSGLFTLLFSSVLGQVFSTNLEETLQEEYWINTQSLKTGNAHSGSVYSVADVENQFGLGIERPFPATVHNRNVVMKAEGWVMSSSNHDKAGFVISIFDDHRQLFWKNIDLTEELEKKSTWYYFSDTLLVPAGVTTNGKFKCFLWNYDQQDTVAIDDLKVSFSPFNNPSFLPEQWPPDNAPAEPNPDLLFLNRYYKLFYYPNEKTIKIYSLSDSLLIRSLQCYYSGKVNGKQLEEFTNAELKEIKRKGGKTLVYLEARSQVMKKKVMITCYDLSPKVDFAVSTNSRAKTLVSRHALLIESGTGAKKVYRDDRLRDVNEIEPEYWLDKEGVVFGSGKNVWMIYHVPGVSSLQLDNKRNALWVNLEYDKDHPFLHFPLLEDSMDIKYDRSEALYRKRTKYTHEFSIFLGKKVDPLPRFMKSPDGFLATYIWTEHADFTSLRTNRAVYFGSEKIQNADSASGGFVRYNIPVTKSVFYSNPDGVTNERISNGLFTGYESSLMEEKAYNEFIDQLRSRGVEVCLHTPENFTSTKKSLEEALEYMHRKFEMVSWIDHGYNNGETNNREDLVCDGNLKNSEVYAMPLWNKFGVKYFWNPYFEDYFTFDSWKFGESLIKPYPGYGHFLPDPDYWRHPTRTGDLVHWPTKSVLFVPDQTLWDYYFAESELRSFINQRGVEVNHCYPAWVDPEKGFWIYGPDSTIISSPGFNKTLKLMADLRKQGLLNVTTVRDYINYRLSCDDISYELLPDGRIKISNDGKQPVIGLSFAVNASIVLVDGQLPNQKHAGRDIVFWFDLPAGESKLIRTIE